MSWECEAATRRLATVHRASAPAAARRAIVCRAEMISGRRAPFSRRAHAATTNACPPLYAHDSARLQRRVTHRAPALPEKRQFAGSDSRRKYADAEAEVKIKSFLPAAARRLRGAAGSSAAPPESRQLSAAPLRALLVQAQGSRVAAEICPCILREA